MNFNFPSNLKWEKDEAQMSNNANCFVFYFRVKCVVKNRMNDFEFHLNAEQCQFERWDLLRSTASILSKYCFFHCFVWLRWAYHITLHTYCAMLSPLFVHICISIICYFLFVRLLSPLNPLPPLPFSFYTRRKNWNSHRLRYTAAGIVEFRRENCCRIVRIP